MRSDTSMADPIFLSDLALSWTMRALIRRCEQDLLHPQLLSEPLLVFAVHCGRLLGLPEEGYDLAILDLNLM
jgi:hypothetical protein